MSVPLTKADKLEEINKLKIKYSAKDNWKEKHLNSIYFTYKKCDHFEKIYEEINKLEKREIKVLIPLTALGCF